MPFLAPDKIVFCLYTYYKIRADCYFYIFVLYICVGACVRVMMSSLSLSLSRPRRAQQAGVSAV
jgi:hypothetical protein